MIAYLIAMGTIGLLYCLLALGLNLQFGFTGLINFGHVASFALGAYTSTLLAVRLDLPLALTITAGAVVAGLAAYPVGVVSLRLKEDYLAVVTIGFAEVLRLIIMNEAWLTEGTNGITDVPPLFRFLPPQSRAYAFFLAVLLVTVAVYLFLRHLTQSPFGRTLRAIQANEEAARALGKASATFKMWSLAIGAAIGGSAGGLYAHYMQYISPDQFTPEVTFFVWIGMILGGKGKHMGAIVGTFALMLFMEGTRFAKDLIPHIDATKIAAGRLMTVGLALVVLMLYRPEGLMGGRRPARKAAPAAGREVA